MRSHDEADRVIADFARVRWLLYADGECAARPDAAESINTGYLDDDSSVHRNKSTRPMIGMSHDSIAPRPQFIRLTWVENYVAGFTNEQTEIDESTDLVNWATCFTGATNECWIQEIYPFAFYRAKNFLP